MLITFIDTHTFQHSNNKRTTQLWQHTRQAQLSVNPSELWGQNQCELQQSCREPPHPNNSPSPPRASPHFSPINDLGWSLQLANFRYLALLFFTIHRCHGPCIARSKHRIILVDIKAGNICCCLWPYSFSRNTNPSFMRGWRCCGHSSPCSADQNQHWCIILFPFSTLTLACAINPKICIKEYFSDPRNKWNIGIFKDKERFSWFSTATLKTGKNISASRSKLKSAVRSCVCGQRLF